MGWLNREPAKLQETSEKKTLPEGLWAKCSTCNEVTLTNELLENLRVCPQCGFHNRMPAEERIELLIDKETFYEWDHDLCSVDPLQFDDGRSYSKRIEQMSQKTGRYDAVITGVGHLAGRPVAIGVLDFFWMGGSMGAVVGERIARLFLRAIKLRIPVILVSSSGGARMHEGLVSLMQMGKTCVAVAKLRDAGFPYISVLCDPTTGGVAASYALLGDLNFAEPKSTIGFAGRRVIETTIRQQLPDDFQTAEFLLLHGMLDRIVKRAEMKEMIANALSILCP